jgi:hypothetical protein
VIPLLLLIFGTAIAIGLWRKAGPIQWIWLLFGAAITMLVLWVLLVLFVVGPEMRRSPLPGDPARNETSGRRGTRESYGSGAKPVRTRASRSGVASSLAIGHGLARSAVLLEPGKDVRCFRDQVTRPRVDRVGCARNPHQHTLDFP